MNRRQFLFVLLALAILGSAGLMLFKHNRQSWVVGEAKAGDAVLPGFQFNEVSAIHVKGAKADFTVARTDGVWRVRERGDYLAEYPLLKNLLLKIRELKVARSESVGPAQLAQVGLEEPGNANGGSLIEFKDGQGRLLGSLLLGKRHLRPESSGDPFRMRGLFDGCYVLLPKDPQNVLLISDDLASVSAEPGAWLDRNFVKVRKAKSVSRADENGNPQWRLTRESESKPWKLATAKPDAQETVQEGAIAQTVEILEFLGFIDVVPASNEAATALQGNPRTVFIETFDSFSYTLEVRGKRPDGNYEMSVATSATIPAQRAIAGDESAEEKKDRDAEFLEQTRNLRDKLDREQAFARWIYVVDSSVLSPLLRDRNQFIQAPDIAQESAVARKDTLTTAQ